LPLDELLPIAIGTLSRDQFLIAPYSSTRQALVSHRFAVATVVECQLASINRVPYYARFTLLMQIAKPKRRQKGVAINSGVSHQCNQRATGFIPAGFRNLQKWMFFSPPGKIATPRQNGSVTDSATF